LSTTIQNPCATTNDQSLIDRIARLPIASKVLFVNVLVVVSGALIGTYLTAGFVMDNPNVSRAALVLGFASLGTLLSVLVNYWVLKAAFEPLKNLERVAEAVHQGDFSARAVPSRFCDPQLERFGQSLNHALEVIEADREQIRLLADRVIDAQEAERKRIARELHDDTAQLLFAQLLRVSALSSSPHHEVRETASQIGEMMSEAMESVRRLGHELRPPALDDLGLKDALEDLANRMSEQMGIPVEFSTSDFRKRVDPAVELVLYRVAQEALTNTWKHAHATRVRGGVTRDDDGVRLVIEDDGIGFDASAPRGSDGRGIGMGLFGMAERVELVGGTLTVDGARHPGTRIDAYIPLAPPDSAPAGRQE
jgi:two-component system, NarL family, sensor histidine kinase UhpB